jgi:hypothetical protein
MIESFSPSGSCNSTVGSTTLLDPMQTSTLELKTTVQTNTSGIDKIDEVNVFHTVALRNRARQLRYSQCKNACLAGSSAGAVSASPVWPDFSPVSKISFKAE